MQLINYSIDFFGIWKSLWVIDLSGDKWEMFSSTQIEQHCYFFSLKCHCLSMGINSNCKQGAEWCGIYGLSHSCSSMRTELWILCCRRILITANAGQIKSHLCCQCLLCSACPPNSPTVMPLTLCKIYSPFLSTWNNSLQKEVIMAVRSNLNQHSLFF